MKEATEEVGNNFEAAKSARTQTSPAYWHPAQGRNGGGQGLQNLIQAQLAHLFGESESRIPCVASLHTRRWDWRTMIEQFKKDIKAKFMEMIHATRVRNEEGGKGKGEEPPPKKNRQRPHVLAHTPQLTHEEAQVPAWPRDLHDIKNSAW